MKEGDYVLAVNGVPLSTDQDPLAAFQGLADKTAILTVNGTPSHDGARAGARSRCLGDDTQLRYREWIEARRAHVEQGHERPRRLHLRARAPASTGRTS